MKIFQITMGLLVGAVLFFGSNEPANALCQTTYTELPGTVVEVDNQEPTGNGICVRDTNTSTFNVTAAVVGDAPIAAIFNVQVGIYVENDDSDNVNMNVINVSDLTTVTSAEVGIWGDNNNTYNIDGTLVTTSLTSDTGITLLNDNTVNLGASSSILGFNDGVQIQSGNTVTLDGLINTAGFGLYSYDGNDITVNGQIISRTGIDLWYDNDLVLGENAIIEAVDYGIFSNDANNRITVNGTINAGTGTGVDLWDDDTFTLGENGEINALVGVTASSGENVTIIVDGAIESYNDPTDANDPGIGITGGLNSSITLGATGTINADIGILVGQTDIPVIIDGDITNATFLGVAGDLDNDFIVNGNIDSRGAGMVGGAGNHYTVNGNVHGDLMAFGGDFDNTYILNGGATGEFGFVVYNENDITVNGTIEAGRTGIDLEGNDNDVTVNADGEITGLWGIWAAGTGNTIQVDGKITATGVGVESLGVNDITLGEDGEINAQIGILLDNQDDTAIVNGTINATLFGVLADNLNEITVGENGEINANIGIGAYSQNIIDVHGEINATTIAAIEAVEAADVDDPLTDIDETIAIDSELEHSAVGVFAGGRNTLTIHETGKVISEHTGVLLGARNGAFIAGSIEADHTGVLMVEDNFLTVEETGSVSGGVVGVYIQEDAANSFSVIHNMGVIEASGLTETTPGCADIQEVQFLNCHSLEAGTIYGIQNGGRSDLYVINEGVIRALDAEDGSYVGMAIHDGSGAALIVNMSDGVIEGDIYTHGNADTIVLMAGSTTDGNIDMGVTPATVTVDAITQNMDSTSEDFGEQITAFSDGVPDFTVSNDSLSTVTTPDPVANPNFDTYLEMLVAVVDDPLTAIDESAGGTLYTRAPTTDGSVDILYLSDAIVDLPIDASSKAIFNDPSLAEWDTTIDGVFNGDVTEAELLIKRGEATWSLGGNVNIDGVVHFDPDGTAWTQATTVMEGRLNVNGTLTSPIVMVYGGSTLGGDGTIVTDPGTPGTADTGEGGVILSGLVLHGDREQVHNELWAGGMTPEEQAAFLEENGLPENFVDEVFLDENGETINYGNFQSLDADPNYAVLAPGNSTGTLNVVGNFYFKDKETAFTTYNVSGTDDRETQDNDPLSADYGATISPPDGVPDFDVDPDTGVVTERGDGTPVDLETQLENGDTNWNVPDGVNDYEFVQDEMGEYVRADFIYTDNPTEGREVVTDWGSVYEAELATDGQHDRLNVTKSGATSTIDTIITVDDPLTLDVDEESVVYQAGDTPDGVVFLGGRLDIQLDDYITSAAYEEPVSTRYNHYGLEGHIYDIIVAEGGVEGVFQDIGFDGGGNDGTVLLGYKKDGSEARLPVFKGFLEYMPDRVRITSIPIFQHVGETDNQIAVGRYIDPMALYGVHQDPLQGAFAALGQSGNVLAALDRMTPEFVDPFNSVALTLSHSVVDTILDRAYGAHSGVSTNISSVGNGYGSDSSAGSSGSGNSFNFWAGGNWNKSDVSNDDGFIEYEYKTLMGYFGAEYLIGDTGMIGAVISLGNTDLDYGLQRINDGEADHWSISGYGSYFIGDMAHVTAGGGHGNMDIQTERTDALDNQTHAKYDGDYTYFFAEVAGTFDLGNSLSLTPSVDVTHTKIKQDAFAETGDSPFALEVDAQSNKSLRGAVRARLAYDWEPEMGHLIAYVTAGVAHEFKDGQHILNARFVGDDGNFTIHGAGFHGTSALVNLGMTAILNEIWAIDASYNGEFGESYDNHGFSLNVQASF